MKAPNVLMRLFLGVAMMSSCAGDENLVSSNSERDGKTPVIFSSHIVDHIKTKTSKAEDPTVTLWNIDDEIGIYMIPISSTPLHSSIVRNIPYIATSAGKFTNFKAKNAEIFYPRTPKSLVNFVAYYPYKADIEDSIYNLNISRQGDQSKIDLLYSTVNEKTRSADPVTFKFSHMLSHVIVNIVLEDGKLIEIAARVYGMSPSASFNLLTGTLDVLKVPKESLPESVIYPKIIDNGCSVLFFPEEGAPIFQFTISSDIVQYTKVEWKLPLMKFEPGKQYIYTLRVGINGIIANGEVQDWVVSDIGQGSVSVF